MKIDPNWAKGYKCKGLALEGMGRAVEAIELLFDGTKMCGGRDPNAKEVLDDLIQRLNRATGFLDEGYELLIRKKKEKYCVTCERFEKDMGGSVELDDGKKFVSCDKCNVVNYCSREHRDEDKVKHGEVCEELLLMRKASAEDFFIQISSKENAQALGLFSSKPKGTERHGHENVKPLYVMKEFKPVTKAQQKGLDSWDDLFTMLEETNVGLKLTTGDDEIVQNTVRRTLTEILTDPMTVFYAMKKMSLLDNGDEDKVIRLHVVGAEPNEEIRRINEFLIVMSSTGRKIHVVYIGPLLKFPPGEEPKVNPAITLFQGNYQEYILTSEYEEPDCIVAFYPGLYDYPSWLPVVFQAIVKKVPFLVTCDSKEDYNKTKEWMELSVMKPEIVQDYLNPFASTVATQNVPGSNSVCKRNMFSLLLIGGDLHAWRPFLQVRDEKAEIPLAFRDLRGTEILSDIVKLNNSGKM
jgi:hypothetical protein